MNKQLPINMERYKCCGCGGVIKKGVLNARLEKGEPITKWHTFCDLCYKKWYLDDLKRKIANDTQVLRDMANAAGYIIKKVNKEVNNYGTVNTLFRGWCFNLDFSDTVFIF